MEIAANTVAYDEHGKLLVRSDDATPSGAIVNLGNRLPGESEAKRIVIKYDVKNSTRRLEFHVRQAIGSVDVFVRGYFCQVRNMQFWGFLGEATTSVPIVPEPSHFLVPGYEVHEWIGTSLEPQTSVRLSWEFPRTSQKGAARRVHPVA